MPFERPRVRAEGPGGPDVKQGARIACLDCRSAKIRCSAPTDGKVPCKRCARHGRECVFEKHRRGRKPGRSNNAKAYMDTSMTGFDTDGSGDDGGSFQHRDRPLLGASHSNASLYHGDAHSMAHDNTHGSNAYNNRHSAAQHDHSQHQQQYASSSVGGASSSSSSSNNNNAQHHHHSHPHNASWRHTFSQDDPRLVSPHAGTSMRSASALPSSSTHHTTHPNNMHHSRYPSDPSPPPLPLPHTRRVTSGAHPSYMSSTYGLPSQITAKDGGMVAARDTKVSHGPTSSKSSSSSPSSSPVASYHRSATSDNDALHGRRQLELRLGSSGSYNGTSGNNSDIGINALHSLPRFNPSTFSPPSSNVPIHALGTGTTPGRSWLDFPTPGTRSLLSPSHLMMTSISTYPTSNGSMFNAWPGSAITSPHKRKGPMDYFAGAVPPSGSYNASTTAGNAPIEGEKQHPSKVVAADEDESPALKKRKIAGVSQVEQTDESAQLDNRTTPQTARAVLDEDEEQVDHIHEDEMGGASDRDVLATPLRLLAHASDAAMALRQAKGDAHGQATQRSTYVGAATMGLVSPPVPSLPAPRKWFDSGRLPSMVMGPTEMAVSSRLSTLGSGLLPRLASVAQRRDLQRASGVLQSSAGERAVSAALPLYQAPREPSRTQPPSLGNLGRSRSYTAVNAASAVRHAALVHSSDDDALYSLTNASTLTTSVTQNERRAEVLGIHTAADGSQVEVARASLAEQAVTATTLDPDAWEYRNGRVRSRKSISAAHSGSTATTATSTTPSAESRSASVKTPTSNFENDDGVRATSNVNSTPATSVAKEMQSTSASESSAKVCFENHEVDNAHTDPVTSQPLTFRSRLGSVSGPLEAQKRWEVVRRRTSKPNVGLTEASRGVTVSATAAAAVATNSGGDSTDDVFSIGGLSDESEKLGASHQDFFSMSIFHSKMDNEPDLDPVEQGLLHLSELEQLFDIFFARINPLLTIFDPFLHSVTHVRIRSALLTTVIAALAARMSDNERHAKLAVTLENHWRQKLLPEALLGGYKSVEIAQAFLVLALYQKPTNRMSDDRSWQYLGFAIRIATEIGINRLTQPSDEVKDNEQVRRRVRNRLRLWICLWLTDRSMCLQTGRPYTIMEDDMIANSDLWHRELFALPEDARLVSLIKLTRVVTTCCCAFATLVTQHSVVLHHHLVATSEAVVQAQETIKSLNFARLQAVTELDRWKDIWCVEALDESNDGIQSLAIGTFLGRWRPRAKIDLHSARLHLNSTVLEALERHHGFLVAASASVVENEAKRVDSDKANKTSSAEDERSITRFSAQIDETKTMMDKVTLDCWETSLRMIDILLKDVPEEDLSAGPNALSVNVIYGALAALRLSNAGQHANRPWADRDVILKQSRALADALIRAGRTPGHRNGAAAPFGAYLKSIVVLWESEKVGITGKDGGRLSAKDNGEPEGVTDESDGRQTLEREPQRAGFTNAHQRSNTDPAQVSVSSPSRPTDNRANANGKNIGKAQTSCSLELAMPHVQKHHQQHSVGDDVWGGAFSATNSRHSRRASQGEEDPASIDRMWDYLTTYPDPVSSFPMSLWQTQLNNSANNDATDNDFTSSAVIHSSSANSTNGPNGVEKIVGPPPSSNDAAAAMT